MSDIAHDLWDRCDTSEWYLPLGLNAAGDPRDVFIEREIASDGAEVYWVDVRDAGLPIVTPDRTTTLALAKERGDALAERYTPNNRSDD